MHQTTKLKLIALSIVLGTLLFIAIILNLALSDEPTFTAGEALPTERLQTYTVQGLTVQTTSTPDFFAVLAMVSLAKDQAERVAIMKEARITFNGPLNQFNQLLNPLKLTATSTAHQGMDIDQLKADCEAQGADFTLFRGDITNVYRALCTIRSKQVFEIEL